MSATAASAASAPPPHACDNYALINTWEVPVEAASSSETLRCQIVKALSHLSSSNQPLGADTGLKQAPITWWQETIVCLSFLVVFGSMLWGPPALCVVLYLNPQLGLVFTILLAYLAVCKVQYWEESLQTLLSQLVLQYFSYKSVCSQDLDPKRRYILVAPPHGAFPMGNICTCLAMPRIGGFAFKGLAASAVINSPVIRQVVTWIGGIDASKEVAEAALRDGWTIGIPSGGIAEIFETNNNDETIILRRRKGIVRLAFRTGTPIVPCYVFGNSVVFSLVYDSYGILNTISRALKFSVFFFWGRWGLPIPYRVPLLGVIGEPIEVPYDPSCPEAEIDRVHGELMLKMKQLFDKYKHLYGWQNKQLIIK